MSDNTRSSRMHGEGDHESDRRYREATKAFVQAGKVDEAARKARPAGKSERKELERAEAAGRERAKS